ncbi:MAG: hypothetical protein JJU03_09205 [Idiomarina sp.]|nr:hypothetical protein [Idiomarina sp.]
MADIVRLEEAREQLLGFKRKAIDRLEYATSRYWAMWKMKNRQVIKANTQGDRREKPGLVAPSLRVYSGEFGAVYMRWRIYPNNYARINLVKKEARVFAKDISRNKNGITDLDKILKAAREWKEPIIRQTHGMFEPLIREQAAIHESIRKINAAIRAIQRLTEEK